VGSTDTFNHIKNIFTEILPSRVVQSLAEMRNLPGIILANQYKGQYNEAGRYVTYICDGGMANRLKSHLMASQFALNTGRSLLVNWPRTQACGAKYEEIFEWNGSSHGPFFSIKILRFPGFQPSYTPDVEAFISTDHQCSLIVLDTRWQWTSRQQLFKILHTSRDNLLSNLVPVNEIKQEVSNILETWPSSVCGVHIRRGDFAQMGHWLIDIEKYCVAMEQVQAELEPDTKFFIATDAPDSEIAPVLHVFGERILKRKPSLRDTTDGVKEALIDLLLLSKTKRLILTPRSSFGEIAAFWGDVPFVFPEDVSKNPRRPII